MQQKLFTLFLGLMVFYHFAEAQCSPNFAPNYSPLCFGQPVTFTNLSDDGGLGGATYAWDFGVGATPATSNAQNPPVVRYSSAGNKTIKLTMTNNGFLCSNVYSIELTVIPQPTATFTSTAPQCADAPVSFTNTGSSGNLFSYQWNFGPDAYPSSSTVANPTGIIYATGGSKKVSLTTSIFGCNVADTSSIQINVLPTANAGMDTTICNNASVQLGENNNPALSYVWSPVSVLNNGNISNPVANPIAPVTPFVLKVTNKKTGCSASDTVHVTMLAPLIALPGLDHAICQYDSVQIGAPLVTGQTYAWKPAIGVSNSAVPNPIVSPLATTTYTVSVGGHGCAPITGEVKITVHPLPTIEAGGPIDSIAVGQSVHLTASGGVQFNWSPVLGLNNPGIYNPIANPTTTTSYVVTGTDVYGCVNTDTVKIEVFAPNFWMPNAFTPNQATNSILRVHGEGISNFKFSVYNRSGERIFYTSDLLVGWNGNHQGSGDAMPEGAYVCTVSGTLSNGSDIIQTKMVNLIR